MMGTNLKLTVLISGGGRSLANLADSIDRQAIPAEIVDVISSKPTAYGLARAEALGISATTIRPESREDVDGLSARVFERVRQRGATLVCMAGWLWKLAIPPDFTNRVLNIHPALLPAFGGHGMYGHHVHEAVLAAGCEITGCTVHFANHTYDQGPILVQRSCPVADGDTPESLAGRVFEQECLAYPEAVALIAAGKVNVVNGRAAIIRA